MKMLSFFFFFFNDTATTEIYTLSLHDALPILRRQRVHPGQCGAGECVERAAGQLTVRDVPERVLLHGHDHHERSEEHTSELQSRQYLVCRLLLEKKKNKRSLLVS